MSLSRETMLELMALADGELEGEARDRAEKFAAQSDEARRVVGRIRTASVGRWVGEAFERRAHHADGIADAVMARLQGSDVRSSASADGRLRSSTRVEAGVVHRLPGGRSKRSSRIAMAGVVGSALAIAALVTIYIRYSESKDDRMRTASVGTSSGMDRGAQESATAIGSSEGIHSRRGVEVEEIDSTLRVSIFELSAMADTSTQSSVVVWIDDEPGSK